MEELNKKSTIEVIKEMSDLDQQIDLLILKYEKLRLEMIKRFPQIEKDEEFQPKMLKR